jgi:hypothetical protein
MKPVDQTTFGAPGGNCLSACVASILHLPIEDVPYFMSNDIDGKAWRQKLSTWLKARGFYPMFLGGWAKIPGVHMVTGRSPRNVGTHCVVAIGDVIVHDPHPSRAGIKRATQKIMLVPFEPHKVH